MQAGTSRRSTRVAHRPFGKRHRVLQFVKLDPSVGVVRRGVMAETDLIDVLARIAVPTLLIWGERDVRSSLDVARRFERDPERDPRRAARVRTREQPRTTRRVQRGGPGLCRRHSRRRRRGRREEPRLEGVASATPRPERQRRRVSSRTTRHGRRQSAWVSSGRRTASARAGPGPAVSRAALLGSRSSRSPTARDRSRS